MIATRRVAICPKEAWHVVNAFLVRPRRCNGDKAYSLGSDSISSKKKLNAVECTKTGLALHKLTLPFCEPRPVVGQSVAVRCLDVAHWTDAADGGEFIHNDGRFQVRWHGQMFNIHKGQANFVFRRRQTQNSKDLRKKKRKNAKSKSIL